MMPVGTRPAANSARPLQTTFEQALGRFAPVSKYNSILCGHFTVVPTTWQYIIDSIRCSMETLRLSLGKSRENGGGGWKGVVTQVSSIVS